MERKWKRTNWKKKAWEEVFFQVSTSESVVLIPECGLWAPGGFVTCQAAGFPWVSGPKPQNLQVYHSPGWSHCKNFCSTAFCQWREGRDNVSHRWETGRRDLGQRLCLQVFLIAKPGCPLHGEENIFNYRSNAGILMEGGERPSLSRERTVYQELEIRRAFPIHPVPVKIRAGNLRAVLGTVSTLGWMNYAFCHCAGFLSFWLDNFLTVVSRQARRTWNNLYSNSHPCSFEDQKPLGSSPAASQVRPGLPAFEEVQCGQLFVPTLKNENVCPDLTRQESKPPIPCLQGTEDIGQNSAKCPEPWRITACEEYAVVLILAKGDWKNIKDT